MHSIPSNLPPAPSFGRRRGVAAVLLRVYSLASVTTAAFLGWKVLQ